MTILRKLTTKSARRRRPSAPSVVTIRTDEYDSLIETINVLSDPETLKAIEEGEADIASGCFTEYR